MKPRFSLLGASLVVLLVSMACGSAKHKGSLVIGLETDVSVPDNVDGIGISVGIGGAVKYSRLFALENPKAPSGQRKVKLPATIAVVEPDDGSTPQVDIRAVAFHNGDARIVRDVISTVPHGRTALLRMPLAYLGYNDDVHGSVPTTAFENLPPKRFVAVIHPADVGAGLDANLDIITSRCGKADKLTNVDGECVDPTIDSSTLPDYIEQDLFEKGTDLEGESNPEPCFDVNTCFAPGASKLVPLQKSSNECTVKLDGSPDDLNVAMKIQQPADPNLTIGFCVGKDSSGANRCMVPIDRDDVHGFRIDTARGLVILPKGVCDRDTILGIELAHAPGCSSKSVVMPIDGAGANCLDDGNNGTDGGAEGGADAGTDGDAGSFPMAIPYITTTDATQVAAVTKSSVSGDVIVITKSNTLSYFRPTTKGPNALSTVANASPNSKTGAAFLTLDETNSRLYATFGDSNLVAAAYLPSGSGFSPPNSVQTIIGLSGNEKLGAGLGACNDGPCLPDDGSMTTYTTVSALAPSAQTSSTAPFGTAYAFALGTDNVTVHGAYSNPAGGMVIATGLIGALTQTWSSATALRAYGLIVVQSLNAADPVRVVITVAQADKKVHVRVLNPSNAADDDLGTIGSVGSASPEPFLMRNLASDASGNVYLTDDLGNLKQVTPFTLGMANYRTDNAVCPGSLGVSTDLQYVYRACSTGVTRDPIIVK